MTRHLLFLAALALAVPVGGYQGAEHRPGQTLPPAPAPDLSAIHETSSGLIVDASSNANVPALEDQDNY